MYDGEIICGQYFSTLRLKVQCFLTFHGEMLVAPWLYSRPSPVCNAPTTPPWSNLSHLFQTKVTLGESIPV